VALAGLGKAGCDAVPELVEALETGEGDVPLAAVRALEQIGVASPEVLAALWRLAKSDDPERKHAAREALKQLGHGCSAER
jgi:HEAT repeat protein